jgi:hypothetical protein
VARETVRAHIVMPKDLVSSIDRLVGKRARSRFLVEAAEEKLARERRARILLSAAGALADDAVPEWEDSSEWVRHSRERDTARLERLLKAAG